MKWSQREIFDENDDEGIDDQPDLYYTTQTSLEEDPCDPVLIPEWWRNGGVAPELRDYMQQPSRILLDRSNYLAYFGNKLMVEPFLSNYVGTIHSGAYGQRGGRRVGQQYGVVGPCYGWLRENNVIH